MSTTANRVMDDYSSLDETEQAEFDRRYKELMGFRRQLNQLVRDHVRSKAVQQEMSPLDVACPTCKVPPGLPCRMRDIPMTVRQASEGTTSTHASRIRKVK